MVWKGIAHGLELLKRGTIWRIGDGNSVTTWRDPWIPRRYDFRPITPERNCQFNRVSAFLDTNGAWIVDRIHEHFWPMDVVEMLKIRTSPRNMQDFIGWYPEPRGNFTVKSAYKLATDCHDDIHAVGASSSRPDGNRTIWNSIWKSQVPLKMSILAWKTASGALATNLCKVQRHLPVRSSCPVCVKEEASSFHALITCMHARQVWDGLRKIWPLPDDVLLIESQKDWLLQILSNCPVHNRDMVIMIIWRIRQLRNDITHGKGETPVQATVITWIAITSRFIWQEN